MKTKKIFVSGLCLLLAAACQPTTQKADNTSENAKQETKVAVEEQKTQPFMSADAVVIDVRGKVKEMTTTTYSYNEQGKIDEEFAFESKILFDDDINAIRDEENTETEEEGNKRTYTTKTISKKLNSKNQLSTLILEYKNLLNGELSYMSQKETKYEYDEQGRLAKQVVLITGAVDGYEEDEYTYNEAGDLTRSVSKWQEGGSTFITKHEYEIQEKDHFGNWIKRKITSVTIEEENPDDKTKDASLEKRTIIYQ